MPGPRRHHGGMTFPRTIFLAATSLVAFSLAVASAPAATVLSTETAPTRVAAYGGLVMWSQLDTATGRYRLVQSLDGGAPVSLGVRERETPFDVDLGSDRAGHVSAVYTRNGDIVRLNPRSRVEGQVLNLSSPTAQERDPSLMRGEISFIRREGGYDQLRTGNTTRASHGSHLVVKARTIVSQERGTSHVSYVTQSKGRYGFGQFDVHVRNIATGHDQVVYRATSGGANFAQVTKAAFAENAFFWARTNNGSGAGNRIVRYQLRGSRLSYGAGSSRYDSLGWAGGDLGAAVSTDIGGGATENGACEDAGRSYCSVSLTGPVSFTLRP